MDVFKISYKDLKSVPVKTNPKNVKESNENLFYSRMNLHEAARNCGMTPKEMKLTFYEFLKYNPPTFKI